MRLAINTGELLSEERECLAELLLNKDYDLKMFVDHDEDEVMFCIESAKAKE